MPDPSATVSRFAQTHSKARAEAPATRAGWIAPSPEVGPGGPACFTRRRAPKREKRLTALSGFDLLFRN